MTREPQAPQGRPPEVSVVIPTRNHADRLPRAIASVLRQEGPGRELIVVDDGSSDQTAAAARSEDPRLRYLFQRHRGVSAARNHGVELARGSIVAFLDSDDEARPGWLTALIRPFTDPRVGAACCAAEMVSDERKQVLAILDLGPAFSDFRGLFLAGTFAVRRDLFLTVGGYTEGLAFSENTELALRLLAECRRAGLRVTADDRALLRIHRERDPTDWLAPEKIAARLAASEFLLENHRSRLARDRPLYGKVLASGGVRAARLNDFRRARRLFGAATLSHPAQPRHLARLVLSCIPLLARRVWSRRQGASGMLPTSAGQGTETSL